MPADADVNGEDPGLNGAPSALTAGARLSISAPGPASYLATGPSTASGDAVQIGSVTVNGDAATVSGDAWEAQVTLARGLNVLEVLGTEADGTHRAVRSALAGEFEAPTGFVDGAVQLHLATSVLDQLAPLAEQMLDPVGLSAQVTANNPVLVDGSMEVSALAVEFSGADVSLVPTDGSLQLTVTISDFHIPLSIIGAPLDFDAGDMTADALTITSGITIAAVDGELDVQLVSPAAAFTAFDVEVNNVLANLFIDPADMEGDVLAQLDPLLQSTIPGMISGFLDDLDLTVETEVLGQPLTVLPRFASVAISPAGIGLGVDVDLDAPGVLATGAGYLHAGPPAATTGDGVLVQVADDLANRALHELWGAGVLDLEIPVAPGDLTAFLLGAVGGVNGTGGSLGLSPRLPPVLVETSAGARLQLGEVDLTLGTPGGAFGDEVLFTVTIDAAADLVLADGAAGIVLSDAHVTAVPRGASASIPEVLDTVDAVEAALQLGMGTINDMLSFPLGEVTLPALTITRDASGLATDASLSAEALLGLLEGVEVPLPTPPEDPVVTDPPEDPVVTDPPEDPVVTDPPEDPVVMPPPPLWGQPYEVSVPSDATVYDDDWAVDIDDHTAWVCGFDDVVAYGDYGTWYLNRYADLDLHGSGNIVYARRGADVKLYGTDNIVYADDDADIDDYVGGNTIYIVDPLTFDTSDAPDDGC
ncbi:MAG: hypothetical protein KC656_03760 [Myxococcales bacterium]|nr:hypothetical protein [Myxococcales bacterium]